jgi:hypothetical protein
MDTLIFTHVCPIKNAVCDEHGFLTTSPFVQRCLSDSMMQCLFQQSYGDQISSSLSNSLLSYYAPCGTSCFAHHNQRLTPPSLLVAGSPTSHQHQNTHFISFYSECFRGSEFYEIFLPSLVGLCPRVIECLVVSGERRRFRYSLMMTAMTVMGIDGEVRW